MKYTMDVERDVIKGLLHIAIMGKILADKKLGLSKQALQVAIAQDSIIEQVNKYFAIQLGKEAWESVLNEVMGEVLDAAKPMNQFTA